MSLISSRLNRISPSQTIAISQKARALKEAGEDVISLSAGEPDFPTPPHICEAAKRAMDRGETRYTDVAGTRILRKAAADWLNKQFDTDYTADEIVVSTGGKQVIFNCFLATLNPGDEVIIPAPGWVSYPDIVTLMEAKPVIVPTQENDDFKLSAQALRHAITDKTKWFVLNSPGNPSGAAYSATELRALADVLLEFPNIWVLSDDIYAALIYDGFVAKTLVQIEPRLRARTVTLNGLSKAYAMTGWRVGFSAAPSVLTRELIKLQGQSTTNACSIAQAAALEALTGPQTCIREMVEVYTARRDLVVDRLNAIAGMTCRKPQGAFYAFASVKNFIGKHSPSGAVISDDEGFVTALLEQTGVAAVHGAAFLMPGYFRISYATETALLEEACARIARFCEQLRT